MAVEVADARAAACGPAGKATNLQVPAVIRRNMDCLFVLCKRQSRSSWAGGACWSRATALTSLLPAGADLVGLRACRAIGVNLGGRTGGVTSASEGHERRADPREGTDGIATAG
jgi:hypothetical protein